MSINQALIEAPIQKRSSFLDKFEVKRWLQGRPEGTKDTYLSALRAFTDYTGLSPKQLIDLAEKDREKSTRQRGEPESKIKAFYEYLIKEYPRKIRGRGKRKLSGKKGVSKNLASTYTNAMKGFFRANGFPLDVEVQKAPPKKENFKLNLRPPEIKSLLDTTTNLRDKAIILVLFQSGMGIGELCNLTYGDLAKGLKANEEPLNLHLIRKKEEVEYDTFIGTDAIEAVKAYLAQRERSGEILKLDSPLFTLQFTTKPKNTKTRKSKPKNRKTRKIYSSLIEWSLRTAALKAGLITQEDLKIADMSPCRPHALRTAFMSILKLTGMNNTLVEYMSGHKINPTEKAYLRLTTDELRKLYKQHEKHLSVSTMVDSEKLEELEHKATILEQNSQNNQGVVTALLENGKNKDLQINNMNTFLTQVQESLNKLNNEMDYHRLEDIARYVMAKAPSKQEMTSFLSRRQISEAILGRTELQCVSYSQQAKRWIYIPENDSVNLLTA